MKKALALFLVLFTVLACGGICVFALIEKEQDSVVFTGEAVYGDIKYADGIDVTRTVYLDDARWKSVCTIKDGKTLTDTDFKYYNFGWDYSGSGPSDNGVWLQDFAYPDFRYSLRDDRKLTQGAQKLQADFEKAAKGSSENPATVEIRLSDYFEYYPVGISIWLPEHSNIFCEADYEIDNYVVNKFREFFKIPVPDSEVTTVEAAVSDNLSDGQINMVEEKSKNFYFSCSTAVCNDAAYFTFYNKFYEDGEKVDTSLIPGGYGIYRLPYKQSTYDDMLNNKIAENVFVDEMKMVYPLNEDNHILDLTESSDKSQIYMLSKEGDKHYLTVIDEKTMTDVQKIDLGINEDGVGFHTVKEDYVVLSHYSEQTNEIVIKLYEINNGFYELKADIKSQFDIFGTNLCWDGERLAAVEEYDVDRDKDLVYSRTVERVHYELRYQCGFILTVFDSEKPLYKGKFSSSLDAGAQSAGWSNFYCTGIFDDEEDLIVTIK